MISVSMIVKNESACLADALQSVRDADEIVICDTGSTDATVEIARQYTDKVFTDYEWADNFAEARNHALSKCTGDWVLVIDADETLEYGGMEKIRELIPRLNGHKTVYFDTIAKTGTDRHKSIRLFKNRAGIHWNGRAHNYLNESGGYVSDIKLFYGYSDAHKADPDRTLRILKKAVEENPKLPRETFYLAREYWYKKDYETAIATYKDYLKIAYWGPEIAEAQLQLAKCYLKLGDVIAGRRWVMEALSTNADFREAFLLMAKLSGPRNAERWKRIAGGATNDNVLFVRI